MTEDAKKVFRIRRGKTVQVPAEWVGRFPTKKTIAERPSKQLHKHRKTVKYGEPNKREPSKSFDMSERMEDADDVKSHGEP